MPDCCDFSSHNVGDGRDEFTVELHHGGFFVCYGQLHSYVDEKSSLI